MPLSSARRAPLVCVILALPWLLWAQEPAATVKAGLGLALRGGAPSLPEAGVAISYAPSTDLVFESGLGAAFMPGGGLLAPAVELSCYASALWLPLPFLGVEALAGRMETYAWAAALGQAGVGAVFLPGPGWRLGLGYALVSELYGTDYAPLAVFSASQILGRLTWSFEAPLLLTDGLALSLELYSARGAWIASPANPRMELAFSMDGAALGTPGRLGARLGTALAGVSGLSLSLGEFRAALEYRYAW